MERGDSRDERDLRKEQIKDESSRRYGERGMEGSLKGKRVWVTK